MSNHTGEVLKQPKVAQKYGALPEATRPTKHPPSMMVCKHQYLMSCWSPIYVHMHVMQAEVSEAAHYEAIGVVDHAHPGQGGDFDDEGPATLPEKRDKDRSKGGPNYI